MTLSEGAGDGLKVPLLSNVRAAKIAFGFCPKRLAFIQSKDGS
jgi:hypothetical protein